MIIIVLMYNIMLTTTQLYVIIFTLNIINNLLSYMSAICRNASLQSITNLTAAYNVVCKATLNLQ